MHQVPTSTSGLTSSSVPRPTARIQTQATVSDKVTTTNDVEQREVSPIVTEEEEEEEAMVINL